MVKTIHAKDIAEQYKMDVEVVMKVFGALVSRGLAEGVEEYESEETNKT